MDCKCAIKPVNKRLHFKVDILSVYFRPIIFLKTRDCTRTTTLLIVFILSFNDETSKGIELHLDLVFYLLPSIFEHSYLQIDSAGFVLYNRCQYT